MSPSKRAGDTVEPDLNRRDDDAAPEGDDETTSAVAPAVVRSAPRSASARPKRRSTVAATEATPPPERGSESQRGASSSSITRRSVTGTAPSAMSQPASTSVDSAPASLPGPAVPVAHDPPRTINEPVVGSPIVQPPALPSAGVDPTVRRGADLPVVVPPWPAVTPVSLDDHRDVSPNPVSAVGSTAAPPAPPYATTTMSSHQIAPVPRIVGRRPRVRKVTRVVRHVDPWSVFKVALVFNMVLYGILLTAGVLLWNVAYATGTIDNLERFFESFGWSEFEFDGGAIYHSGWIAGLFGVVGLTGAAVLGATLFNLITDLVGGVRMTVLEEEVVERTSSPMRRFTVRRPAEGGDDPGSELRAEGSSLPARREPVEDLFR